MSSFVVFVLMVLFILVLLSTIFSPYNSGIKPNIQIAYKDTLSRTQYNIYSNCVVISVNIQLQYIISRKSVGKRRALEILMTSI